MFRIYSREIRDAETWYARPTGHVKLFGCKGLIAKMLSPLVRSDAGRGWHVSVQANLPANLPETLGKSDYPNPSVVIDINPKQEDMKFFELLDVWGYSSENRSPILFHLREVLNEKNAGKVDRDKYEFKMNTVKWEIPVYSFLYVRGTISGGKLEGDWTNPGPGATNSALLWKDHVCYFLDCIRETTPSLLE